MSVRSLPYLIGYIEPLIINVVAHFSELLPQMDIKLIFGIFFSDPDSLQDVIPQNVIEEEEKNFKRK